MSEERFGHLLQPIRDLAANWNVNIANELEDYLEVLEDLQFSFAEGGPSLNFAAAALLIQGSACVYSKKVEYLHTLVYQALEFIAERRTKDTRAQRDGGEEGGTAGQADDEWDDEEQFLSLDDVLEEGTGIDMDEDATAQLQVAMRPPAALLALECTGSNQGDGDAGNYRITSCAVHRSGALLLELREGSNLGDDLQPVGSRVGGGAVAPPLGPCATVQQVGGPEGGVDQHMDGGDIGGFSDDDYDAGDAMDAGWGDGMGDDAGLAPDAQHHWPGAAQPQQPQAEEVFDPYKPLDPNSRGTLQPKKFKKAAAVARKLRLRQQQGRMAESQPLEALLGLLQAPSAGLLLAEFGYALKQKEAAKPSQRQGRSAATWQRSGQTGAAFALEDAMPAFEAEQGCGAAENDGGEDSGGDMPFDDDWDAPLGDLALPDMAGHAEAAGNSDWGDLVGDDSFYAADTEELTYEELCRAHIEAFINAAAAAEVQSELAARVLGWRAKMAPALEEEDSRPVFDIHAYGERLLERMEDLSCSDGAANGASWTGGVELTFGEVVRVGPKYEASRCFSAMLQLINNGNVRIDKRQQEEFTLTLLDPVLPHKKKIAVKAVMQEQQPLEENRGRGAKAARAKG